MEVSEGAVVKDAGSAVNNKTGSWRTFRPRVNEKCTACRTCEWYCPDLTIKVKEVKGNKKAVVDYEHCKGCMICMEVCPFGAIEKEREK